MRTATRATNAGDRVSRNASSGSATRVTASARFVDAVKATSSHSLRPARGGASTGVTRVTDVCATIPPNRYMHLTG
jgi:hypothetical protein